MLLRIFSAAIVACFVLAGSAQAQVRSLMKAPDPRDQFVRMCAPRMLGRWEHPEEVCGCLHDHAAAVVEDRDLREALLRGISETGVPTIETDWVPAAKQTEIGSQSLRRSGQLLARPRAEMARAPMADLERAEPCAELGDPAQLGAQLRQPPGPGARGSQAS